MGNYVRIRERRAEYEPAAFVFPLFFTAGLVFVIAMAATALMRADATHALFACLVALLYSTTTPSLWRLGNKLRLYAMPTGYSAKYFGDLVLIKVFWTIGPQSVPILLFCLVAAIVAMS